MAYSEKININLDVDTGDLSKSLGTAVTEFEAAEQAIEGLDDNLQDKDLDIGAEPDKDDIATGVGKAQLEAKSQIAALGPTDIPIGASAIGDITEEYEALKKLANISEDASEGKRSVAKANKTLGGAADKSSNDLDIETRSMSEMVDQADTLEEAKYAVSSANQKMSDSAEDGGANLLREGNFAKAASEDIDKLADSVDNANNSQVDMKNAVRKARAKTDNMSDSMRAAAKVGDLFEDGLGSLSLNVGAFTIALRNFLTQIPLILTGLGAMGAAALGTASAFAALGGAMAALVGVGLLTQAKAIESEFSQIEETGEALMVIMRGVGDMMFRAIEPLRELDGISDYFTEAAEGAGYLVNVLSVVIAEVTTGTDELENFASSAGESFITIQEAIDMLDGSTLINILGSLQEAWALLGDEAMYALEVTGDGLANVISRSAELTARIEGIGSAAGQFSDTMSELAEVGFMIGGGLLPVFETFSSVVERVASFISELDQEMVQNAVTIAALTLAFDKVIGTFGSIINIAPQVILGLSNITTRAKAASGAMAGFRAATFAASAGMMQFLTSATPLFSGMLNFVTNSLTLQSSLRSVALSSNEARDEFLEMAVATKKSSADLDNLSAEMSEQVSQAVVLSSSIDELAEDYRELATSGQLAEAGLAIDSDGPDIDRNIANVERMVPTDILPDSMKGDPFSNFRKSQQKTTFVTMKFKKAMKSLGLTTGYTGKITGFVSNMMMKWLGILNKGIGRIGVMIGSLLGYNSGALSSATATAILDAAITSMTLGVGKLIAGIVGLIAILGGLAVGVIKNSDSIKSSLGGALNVIMSIMGALADFIMSIFIATWDALVMTFQPLAATINTIISSFSSLFGTAKGGSGIMQMLAAIGKTLQVVFGALIRVIGFVGRILMTALLAPLKLIIGIISTVIGAIAKFINIAFLGGGGSGGKSLPTKIAEAFDLLTEAIKTTMSILETFINDAIRDVNKLIEKFNQITGANISTMGEVKLTRDENELQSGGAEKEMEPEGSKNVTLKEDNSTNIDQTVNADPEDKAQLSRVVSDAIAEANSFERRRQGGQ